MRDLAVKGEFIALLLEYCKYFTDLLLKYCDIISWQPKQIIFMDQEIWLVFRSHCRKRPSKETKRS